MKIINQLTCTAIALFSLSFGAYAQEHRFDPPWNTPPESKVQFTVPGIDNVPDLFGDINDPQLVVFFAGNQFMVIDELLAAFKKKHPQYQRVFAETLPPGILAKQIAEGSIVIGNMRITLKPDVYTAGKSRIEQTPEWFSKTQVYAKNRLAIMVQKGNPKKLKGLKDLGRKDLRVAMPNPDFEGIGKRIEEAYVKAGGTELKETIMKSKVKDKSTYLTQIHHRQSPMRILYNQSDAAPVWYTEVYYQKMLGHPVEMIEVPDTENIRSQYIAGQLKNAPHPEAAKDFMDFLVGAEANAIYKKFGFDLP
ncbi:molybdate ABC transporter substrate-binding protein [Pedobacter gandavensis]|uniref:ABC transporter substrate-binding protein n=1 Tax=Pedobacter gandavensis TaxID=2679963 RepID=A0ABR6F1E3_9SPHI|nr:substrate-binding domain-containing protein [Pedobacter gandavensis]MBB2151341.1 ABC transporter substrate-binding protein [Pedobacter gandavensis]